MKKVRLSLVTVMLIFSAISFSPAKSSAQVAVSFQVFYDNLAPYGNWVTYPGYGYVWIPGATVGFRPYVTGGHWAYSDAGWVWVSNYNWGWAPFHYGSWLYDPYYGWIWVPGYDWAPAWVTWGTYNGYYGWAPVGPGFSISVGYYPPVSHWCFMEPRYMVMNDWGNHYYVAHNNQIIINNTTIINNERRISSVSNTSNYGGRAYYSGPRRAEVERSANTSVRTVSLRESGSPGRMQVSDNTVSVYRPRVESGSRSAARPSKVEPIERYKAPQNAERTGSPALQRSNEINKAGQRSAEGTAPVEKRSGNRQAQPAQQQRPSGTREMTPTPERGAQQQRSQPQQERTAPAQQQQKQERTAPPQQQQQRQERSAQPQQQQPKQERTAPAQQQQRQMTPAQHPNRGVAPAQKQERTAPAQQQQKQQPPAQRKEEGRPK